jgi:ribosome-associated translation inhibitor RaiA
LDIEIRSGNHVDGGASVTAYVQDMVQKALSHFHERITHVTVHLGDDNGQNVGANDKHCTIEVHPSRLAPVVVRDEAMTIHQAVRGATRKIKAALESSIGREHDLQGRG